MGKVLVSIAAAQASPYVRASKPSEYIPFKGEFPLVDVYSSDKYNEEIFFADNNVFPCPDALCLRQRQRRYGRCKPRKPAGDRRNGVSRLRLRA